MTICTTWTGDRDHLKQADLILTEIIADPVDATSLVRDDDGSSEPDKAPWLLHAYTQAPLSTEVLDLLPREITMLTSEHLAERDWVAHSLEGLGIVRAGPFVLYGRHDADKLSSDGIPIQVEANQAFGTGHHPTTAGCLDALGSMRGIDPGAILDLGCGSGVLAMAARRLWPAATIVATDIDETSVAIARDNGLANGIDDIVFETAAGTRAKAAEQNAPFDLVFANILAGPLKELAPDIYQHTATDGYVILAGLLDEQEDGVHETYKQVGFSKITQGGTDRWPVLVYQRQP